MPSQTTNTADTVIATDLVREAQALVRTGRLEEAEQLWRDILADSPGLQVAALGLVKLLDARAAREDAEQVLRKSVEANRAPSNVLAAARVWEEWQDTPVQNAKILRVAMTGGGTLNPLAAHLRVGIAQAGLHPALFLSDFGQWAQDLLSPQSSLYQFQPDLIIVALDSTALIPKTMADAALTAEGFAEECKAGIEQIGGALDAIRQNAPSASVVLHTFAMPDYSPLGIADMVSPMGQRQRLEDINQALVSLAQQHAPRVVLFDQERVEARHGKARVRDDRLWYMASMPFSDSFLPVMADEYMRIIRAIKGLTRKCIVLDLDNTLWGGVIGEDGINQIKVGGSSAPGNAFYDFQLALRGLKARGILLALCSKNNPDDVWPVLDKHPGMALRRSDFAAIRINWNDKAANIIEIAAELNIGLDSLVFMDDNPAEQGLIRQQVPQVLTVEMPRDPAFYARTLRELGVFETLSLTPEDQRRSEQYQEQQQREQFKAKTSAAGDLTAYLSGLEIVVEMAPVNPFTVPRIAQLINKTNQFNLTTRRYTEPQIVAMAENKARWAIYSVTVSDKFGDSGLTGVAIIEKQNSVWIIDSFLLSCRVLGRGIEQALVAYIADLARAGGASELHGRYLPTAKNAPAADFYSRMKFQRDDSGQTLWRISTADGEPIAYPKWLTIKKTKDTDDAH